MFGIGNTVVLWMAASALLAAGLYTGLQGWRAGRRLRRWGRRRGLPLRSRKDSGLAEELERRIGRDSHEVTRSFAEVRDVVADGEIAVFRCLEELDLSPWHPGSPPLSARVAVVFPAPEHLSSWTMFDTTGRQAREIPPGVRFADGEISERLQGVLAEDPPPRPLSVTVAGGLGVAYLARDGQRVSEEHLDYLRRTARRLSDSLAPPAPSPPRERRLVGHPG